MVAVGDTVCYGLQGVCLVDEKVRCRMDGEDREYWRLCPVYSSCSAVYVPLDNEALVASIRPVLTKSEVDKILAEAIHFDLSWIENDDKRREIGAAVIHRGDPEDMMRLIGMLYIRRRELKANGKKLHLADERLFKEAERLFNGELAFVLEIPPERVPAYIVSRLEK